MSAIGGKHTGDRIRVTSCGIAAAVLGVGIWSTLAAATATAQCDATLLEHHGGTAAFFARSGSRTYAVFGDELFIYESPAPGAAPLERGRQLAPGDHLRDIAADGDHAYLVARNSGLIVVDASDPNAPQIAGTLALADDPLRIACADGYVYTGYSTTGTPTISVIDVSDPASPALVGSYSPGTGYVHDIDVDGGELYASTNSGVHIVDISTPAAPTFITTYYFGIAYLELDVAGGVLAAVRRDTPDVDVADVSNPAGPTAQAIIATSSLARVALSPAGDRLFISDSGTDVWNIGTLTAPLFESNIGSTAADLAASNTRLLTAGGSAGLESWDLADVADPVRAWQVVRSPQARDLAADNDRLLLVEGDELRVYDSATQGVLAETGSVRFSGVDAPEEVAFAGDDLACVIRDDELAVIDLARPAGPARVGDSDTLTFATAIAATETLALVGQIGSLVEIFDISDPAHPTSRGSIDLDPNGSPLSGSVRKIVILDNHACVTTFGDAFIISFADPAQPRLEYAFNVVDPPVDVAVRPGLLALTNNDQLRVDLYDLSGPPLPAFVGAYDETILTPSHVALDGDLLVIFDDSEEFSELVYVDIADPANPVRIGSTRSNPYCEKLVITGDRIWRRGGSNPSNHYRDTGIWELTRPGFDPTTAPQDVGVCPGGTAVLTVAAGGAPAYQWRRAGVDLTNGFTGNGSFISGVRSATLTILSTDPADAGRYDCVLTGSCGTSTTPSATLRVCTDCFADLDCDCDVYLSDAAILLANLGTLSGAVHDDGDLDADGDVDLHDLADMQVAFGCVCDA